MVFRYMTNYPTYLYMWFWESLYSQVRVLYLSIYLPLQLNRTAQLIHGMKYLPPSGTCRKIKFIKSPGRSTKIYREDVSVQLMCIRAHGVSPHLSTDAARSCALSSKEKFLGE